MESIECSGHRALNQRPVHKSLRADEIRPGFLCLCWVECGDFDEKLAYDIANLFCEMSLASLSSRKGAEDFTEKVGLTLHDLHLEFCKQEAESKNSHSLWNSRLLGGYLEGLSNVIRP